MWQTIESVPIGRDKLVLMWSPGDGFFVGCAWYPRSELDGVMYSDYPGCIEGNDVAPTHWMQLPDAPEPVGTLDIGAEVWVVRRTSIRTGLGIKWRTDFVADGSPVLAGFAIVERNEHGLIIDRRRADGCFIVQLDRREEPTYLYEHSLSTEPVE